MTGPSPFRNSRQGNRPPWHPATRSAAAGRRNQTHPVGRQARGTRALAVVAARLLTLLKPLVSISEVIATADPLGHAANC
jgi:hypothetical protein